MDRVRNTLRKERTKLIEYKYAMQEDIGSLLELFQSYASYSFKDFSRCWYITKFGLIFLGKHHCYEVATFIQNLFIAVKKFLLFGETDHVKVGALFTLYGLYYKQPFEHLVKIRLLKNEFISLVNFINEMRIHRHLEPVYTYSKLLKDDAFDFVYTQYPLSPTLPYEKEDLTLKNDISIGSFNADKEIPIVVTDELKKAQDIDNEYKVLLNKYLDKTKYAFQHLDNNLKTEYEAILNLTAPEASNSNVKNLKKRAFSNQVKQSRIFTSVLDEVVVEEEEEEQYS